jgi:hypothetical protein
MAYDIEWLRGATFNDLKNVLKQGGQALFEANALLQTPEGKKIGYEMVNDPDYVPVSKRVIDPEEQEQIDADLARANDQEAADAQLQADEQAAAAALSTPVVPEPVKAPEPPKKIVIDYQVCDEDGRPIGRPTHLEGWAPEEIYEKFKAAHINAVQYAERIKRNQQRLSAAAAATRDAQAKRQQSEAEAATALEQVAKDPTKVVDAVRKANTADQKRADAEREAQQYGQLIADTWMFDHKHDFVPCDANSTAIMGWLGQNNLEPSYENFEKAFKATQSRLVRPSAQVEDIATPVANPQVVAPVAASAPAAVIQQPAAAAAVTVPTETQPTLPQATADTSKSTPADATIAQPARRAGVNGGIAPGQLSAERPRVNSTPTKTSTEEFLKQVARMPREEYRKKLDTSKQFRDQLRSAGIKVLGRHANEN